MYDDQGNSMDNVSVSGEPGYCVGVDFGMFKDGRYVLTEQLCDSSDEPTTSIMMFYDKDNKETERYRLRELENASRKYAPLEIYKNGKWQKMEIPEEHYVFSLGDVYGYTEKEYEYENDGTKYLSETIECEVASDGTYTMIDKCYDSDGWIDDYAVKYILHYQDEATGINPKVVPTSYCRIIVRGKIISTEGAMLMALYSADGKLVAQSTNGSVEAPVSGLYIVSVDGAKAKVLVK